MHCPLESLEDRRNQRYIRNLIFYKGFAYIFRPYGAKMHHGGPANKWPEKSHHEIDRVIRRKDAEISDAGPKWIPGGQCRTLLQIVSVRQHAALRASTSTGGKDNAGKIFPFASYE